MKSRRSLTWCFRILRTWSETIHGRWSSEYWFSRQKTSLSWLWQGDDKFYYYGGLLNVVIEKFPCLVWHIILSRIFWRVYFYFIFLQLDKLQHKIEILKYFFSNSVKDWIEYWKLFFVGITSNINLHGLFFNIFATEIYG